MKIIAEHKYKIYDNKFEFLNAPFAVIKPNGTNRGKIYPL